MAAVARFLREEHDFKCSDKQVRDYLNALPDIQNHPSRVGAKYHAQNIREYKRLSRAEVWQQLQRSPVVSENIELLRHYKTRTVRRSTLRLDNREYQAVELAALNGRDVIVGYDWWHDGKVTVREVGSERFICEAVLVHRAAFVSTSHLEDARNKRERAQLKRIDVKRDEIIARANLAITHEQQLDAIESLTDEGSVEPESGLERRETEIGFDDV
ncbi:Mu transposase C-terminal domain-containing protein [Shewanella algae]|uniref:Mu transposase C-terminal domain-containing protein n=1 Tax=Shewanella algae TaxID=38313 RepID=UPI001AAE0530|nr:Mu transposase C-terminal domain-containing protein [Shewanella algae]MBO2656189.1 Mu transposase C-terminal domain-containing protein [Shewanella algae]